LRRRLHAAPLSLGLACILTGCGSGQPERTNAATTNMRYGAKFKNLVKDGKPIWRPGMKMPKIEGMPKSAAPRSKPGKP
jgi:hypothetical protein